ncbi:hypothetical protein Y032_0040g327 [Ancylostoma ceylanicum]|uniref:Uncharacterized protein n=1 Tax=Ancylostoma ceylanicum TaxID=53326 RepID=A0A016UIE2_9BILA|nr:hypothetical protein Y032_0040g327 [Ancylostoma ceylanicum]
MVKCTSFGTLSRSSQRKRLTEQLSSRCRRRIPGKAAGHQKCFSGQTRSPVVECCCCSVRRGTIAGCPAAEDRCCDWGASSRRKRFP